MKSVYSIRRICALLLAILLLSIQAAWAQEAFDLPEPPGQPIDMVLGERIAARPDPISMQYVSGDGTTFSTITRSLLRTEGNSLLRNALQTWFTSMASLDRMTFIPEDLKVLSVDNCCGLVTVDLSLEAWGIENETELFSLFAALSNTLLSMEGVTGVNFLVGGKAPAIQDLPLGVITEAYPGITPAFAQMTTEMDYFLRSQTATIDRSVALYYPCPQGDCFLPETRQITFEDDRYAPALIRALRSGSREHEIAVSAFPESVDLFSKEPKTMLTSGGERVLQMELSPTVLNYLTFSGIGQWDLLGSLTLTLLSFLPELDALQVTIDGSTVSDCWHGTQQVFFADGLLRRSDFAPWIRSSVGVYLPQPDGQLRIAEKSIAWQKADSPMALLRLLLSEMHDSTMPGIAGTDLLGVSVDAGVATVNLSALFYRACQELDGSTEAAIVYSMVNTLCGLPRIREVRFLVEGYVTESMGGNLYMKGTLFPNPGLIAFPEFVPIEGATAGETGAE